MTLTPFPRNDSDPFSPLLAQVSSGKPDVVRVHDRLDRLAITGYPVSSAETLTYDANKGPDWRWQNDSDPFSLFPLFPLFPMLPPLGLGHIMAPSMFPTRRHREFSTPSVEHSLSNLIRT
jgi:hypothetical protein